MAQDTVYEMVNEKIVAALDKGVVPWRVPWRAVDQAPRNIDGWRYRGINILLTQLTAMEEGYKSPYWLTYKQAEAKGGHVRKGEKSTLIVFWKMLNKTETDESGEKVTKRIPLLRYHRVFNLEQTEDVKVPRKVKAEQEAAEAGLVDHDPIADAEALVLLYKDAPTIKNVIGEAHWQPVTDVVSVPALSDYENAAEYYKTLFHELTHSTGHKDRLNRDISGYAFSTHERGREELVAEFGATYLAAEAGIEQDATLENSAAYIAHWKSFIKDDPRALVVAAGAAQKAADYILGREVTYNDDEKKEKEDAKS